MDVVVERSPSRDGDCKRHNKRRYLEARFIFNQKWPSHRLHYNLSFAGRSAIILGNVSRYNDQVMDEDTPRERRNLVVPCKLSVSSA